jgi:DNA-binding beta-propeller fold protein YncE
MKYIMICLTALTIIMGGCAAPQKVQGPVTVFYPEPPDLPRLEFLTSFTGAKDIEAPKSEFEAFVTGVKESERRLNKPYGIAVYNGKIYVCDTNDTVIVFDLEKRTYGPLQGAQGIGKLLQPFNISIDADGNKYVTDTVRRQVIVFDKNDFYTKTFGMPEEWKPVDAVPFEDRLYVADIQGGEILILNKDTGDVMRKFGRQGEPAERLSLPTNLAFDKDGILYVSDAGRFQVVKYDRDGHFRGTIGRLGGEPGAFARPKGLAVDKENRLYAVDAAFDNVQIFTRDGQLLLFFGRASRSPGGMYLPAKVAIDYESTKYFKKYVDPNFEAEYLVFVTNQFGDQMINIYAFGKEKGKQYPSDEELLKTLREKRQKELEKAGVKDEGQQEKKEPEPQEPSEPTGK